MKSTSGNGLFFHLILPGQLGSDKNLCVVETHFG